MKVVIAEWAAYSPWRSKLLGGTRIECGLGRLLERMREFPSGVELEARLIVNLDVPETPEGPLSAVKAWLERRAGRDADALLNRRLQWYSSLPERYSFVESVQLRSNSSMDLGAYDHGYRQLRREGYEGDVLFVNSSVTGPREANWLLKHLEQYRRHPEVGLCGISLNSHDTSQAATPFAPHVQSFFLLTQMEVLEAALGSTLLPAPLTNKMDVIRLGEIGISRRILDAGYAITCSMFPSFHYRSGRRWTIPEGDLRYQPEYSSCANAI